MTRGGGLSAMNILIAHAHNMRGEVLLACRSRFYTRRDGVLLWWHGGPVLMPEGVNALRALWVAMRSPPLHLAWQCAMPRHNIIRTLVLGNIVA